MNNIELCMNDIYQFQFHLDQETYITMEAIFQNPIVAFPDTMILFGNLKFQKTLFIYLYI